MVASSDLTGAVANLRAIKFTRDLRERVDLTTRDNEEIHSERFYVDEGKFLTEARRQVSGGKSSDLSRLSFEKKQKINDNIARACGKYGLKVESSYSSRFIRHGTMVNCMLTVGKNVFDLKSQCWQYKNHTYELIHGIKSLQLFQGFYNYWNKL